MNALTTPHTRFFEYSARLNLTITPFEGLSDDSPKSLHAAKAWLDAVNTVIDERVCASYQSWQSMHDLLIVRSLAVDWVLIDLFTACQMPHGVALFAIGGYGRGELFAGSDVDILLISHHIDEHSVCIERFVASLWDLGLNPAVSVRGVDDVHQAAKDHTIATALLESRLLVGCVDLCDLPLDVVMSAWSLADFFDAKLSESKARYLQHNATEYNLEPNVKTSPGGLRDLHILLWIGKFHRPHTINHADLSDIDFIDADEASTLKQAQNFLWHIRHHLHHLTHRSEDRLLFDHQKQVAGKMGFYQAVQTVNDKDGKNSQHITHTLEQMMHQYYQHAMQVASLSEMLCADFYDKYVAKDTPKTIIDDDFYHIDSQDTRQIGIRHRQLFVQKPECLLRLFVVMGQHGIRHVTASTLRSLWHDSRLIDENYRQNDMHKRLFLQILRQSDYLFHRLRIMKRYGVLGRYLPAFGKIMGLMQYDLFHRYTVDAHTLLLIRILHRFGDDAHRKQYDWVAQVYQKINRKDILVIAALFHDIAKGRGGDHSELGAIDAYEFCCQHHMTQEDAKLVSWLVKEHLTMSLTAQKKDVYDPEVIAHFAQFTGNIARLNHLYVLTVADMNATNSQLWNAWRASLLKQLYINTHRVLSLEVQADKDSTLKARQQDAICLMDADTTRQAKMLWRDFGDEFFLKQKHTDIAWQSEQIIRHKPLLSTKQPIIALRSDSDVALDAIGLLICVQDQDNLFANTVCVLDQLGLSVLDATVLTVKIDGVPAALDSYVLIDRFATQDDPSTPKRNLLDDLARQQELTDKLTHAITQGVCRPNFNQFRPSIQLQHFNVPTQISFQTITSGSQTATHSMVLITKDCPALLAKIGDVFSKQGIQVHGARITTLGERAEDVFYLSDKGGKTLSDDKLNTLKQALIDALDAPMPTKQQ